MNKAGGHADCVKQACWGPVLEVKVAGLSEGSDVMGERGEELRRTSRFLAWWVEDGRKISAA